MSGKKIFNTCPHNKEVDCEIAVCERCGWNPSVTQARIQSFLGKRYKVPFTGYCEVYAKSEEEAVEMAGNDEMFFVHYEFGEATCLEKEDENELDR